MSFYTCTPAFLLYSLRWFLPALALWAFAFKFIPFCLKAYRAVKEDQRAHADFEERVMLKAISLRERHDALRDALVILVAMHHCGPDAVGNWEWALARAEQALALTAPPDSLAGTVKQREQR